MFNAENVLVLAKAGFTAQQIAGLSMLVNQSPAVNNPINQQPMPSPAANAPVPQPAPTPADPVLAELQKLTGLVQGSNIMNVNQPKVQTAEEILAEIINPAPKGEK